jgi:hypothetical protein
MVISDNTEKINELIEKINSLPVASGSAGSGGGENGVSPTISVESVSGGHNIIITDVNGTESFFVPDGKNGTNGSNGVSVSSIKQTTTSTANGGTNVITATLSNGTTSTFNIKNGTKGSDGPSGVGVYSVTQTTTSSDDGGENIITVTLSNGNTSTFKVKNGSKGSPGQAGSNATINGVNALKLNTSGVISKSQSGSTITIGADLPTILASGPIILKEGIDYHYGNVLPEAGTKGRLFFKKVN